MGLLHTMVELASSIPNAPGPPMSPVLSATGSSSSDAGARNHTTTRSARTRPMAPVWATRTSALACGSSASPTRRSGWPASSR